MYRFAVENHEDYGFVGLVPSWVKNAEPLAAMGAAHDIMEHPPIPEGGISSDNEAMATGVMFYVRGLGGYFHRGARSAELANPGYQAQSDIAKLYSESDTWGDLTDPGRTQRVDQQVEEWIQKGISLAFKELDEYELQRPPLRWASWVRGHIRNGFRFAQKRYAAHHPEELTRTFILMEQALDKELRSADVGDEVLVSYTHKNGFVRAETVNPYDPDHSGYIGALDHDGQEDW